MKAAVVLLTVIGIGIVAGIGLMTWVVVAKEKDTYAIEADQALKDFQKSMSNIEKLAGDIQKHKKILDAVELEKAKDSISVKKLKEVIEQIKKKYDERFYQSAKEYGKSSVKQDAKDNSGKNKKDK